MFYEGKAKKLYSTADPDLVIAYFKDDATAFNGKKKDTIEDKGLMNNRISELCFTLLEIVVRNIFAGSMAKRLGREEGEPLPRPIVEYYYKSDPLDDPLIIGEHAIAFGWAKAEELKQIDEMALKVNSILKKFLDERGVILVDFKLEFGRHHGEILLGDEICPDTCRFWDKATRQKLDKDRFRRDLGGV